MFIPLRIAALVGTSKDSHRGWCFVTFYGYLGWFFCD
jgi:hypothetical protein